MSRRVSLPGAAELFRATDADHSGSDRPRADLSDVDGSGAGRRPAGHEDDPHRRDSGGSGRVRHDEKITVYVSTDELLALEQARLRLRAEHGTAVDRGRIVREAVSLALAELDALGPDSRLVHRLTGT